MEQLCIHQKNVETKVHSKDHTTLVAAVKAAGTVETLIKIENKGTLITMLLYHIITGNLDAADIVAKINAGNRTATLTTVKGGTCKTPFKLYMIKIHYSTPCKTGSSKEHAKAI